MDFTVTNWVSLAHFLWLAHSRRQPNTAAMSHPAPRAIPAELDLRKISFATLQLALYCERTGSLTAAAKMAQMSVARASYRLCALESALGCALFVRHSGGLSPTPAGAIVLSCAAKLLEKLEAMHLGVTCEDDSPH